MSLKNDKNMISSFRNNYVDICGCHDIFCEFIDYLLSNNLTGIFDFPQWDDRWLKGFSIKNTFLNEDQIIIITNYLNRITSQIAVINLYKNDYYENKKNITNWTYKPTTIHKHHKHPHYYWEPYNKNSSVVSKVKKLFSGSEHQNFNLELFCRHIDMCKVLKKYGANKIAFYAQRDERHTSGLQQWYSFSYHLVICKNIRKAEKTPEFKLFFIHKEKMSISKNGCILHIPIPIEPYI